MATYTIVSYCSPPLEHHHIHKASNHPIITIFMHYFYLQHPPTHKWFEACNKKFLLSLLERWTPDSLLNNMKIAWKTDNLVLVNAR